MKKLPLYLMMMVLSLSIIPTTISAAEKNPTAIAADTKEVPAEVKVMLTRLDEIKAMDKSSMNRSEKKALRKEVRAINTELRASHNGIYISVGAVIIILLLILIL